MSGAQALKTAVSEGSPGLSALGSPRPRVAFLSHTAEWIGPTNSLTLLLTHLRERYDLRVFVAGTGSFTEGLDELGIPWDSFGKLDKWELLDFRRAFLAFDPDLLYANNAHSTARIGLLVSLLHKVPFITHVRGMAWHASWLKMGYLRLADRVVAVSDACGESVARFVHPERLVTVHNGIPLEQPGSGSERRQLRDELGIGPDEVLITSVSHVTPRKGQEHSLAAFRLIATRFPNAKLMLVGKLDRSPDYVAGIREKVQEYGLASRVLIPGFRRDIAALLNASDVFVHTAVADPHPRSVIEAMAQELPVVAFAADGVAETVVDEETGFLVRTGDAQGLSQGLSALLSDPALRSSMGKAGRRRVEAQFTDDATARGVAQEIDRVLSSRKGLS